MEATKEYIRESQTLKESGDAPEEPEFLLCQFSQ
jgi:hypothetical protein